MIRAMFKALLTASVILFLLFIFIVGAHAQDQPQLPPFPQRTSDSLFQQLGTCNADLSDMQKWARAMAEQIASHQKELAQLKKKLADAGVKE